MVSTKVVLHLHKVLLPCTNKLQAAKIHMTLPALWNMAGFESNTEN